jgi:hypothetical protein
VRAAGQQQAVMPHAFHKYRTPAPNYSRSQGIKCHPLACKNPRSKTPTSNTHMAPSNQLPVLTTCVSRRTGNLVMHSPQSPHQATPTHSTAWHSTGQNKCCHLTMPPPHTHTCTHLSCASCRVALGPSRLTHNRQQACCYAVMCCASTPVLCPEPQTQPAHSRGGGRPAAASSPGTEAAPCYCCRASTCRGINMNMDVTDTST